MNEMFQISYSSEALDDLRETYLYIAYELKSPGNAKGLINRIQEYISSLDLFPEGHPEVPWEPWKSMHMHFLPVDNYIVFFLVDKDQLLVEIVRVLYAGMDIENYIKDNL